MFGGDKEKIYKYVGLGVIGIVLVYLILRTLKFQMNIIEGLTTTAAASLPAASSPVDNTDIENAPLAINNNSTMVEDTLLINKYKSKYEDIIIELDKNVDFSILQTILKNAQTISMNPTSNDSMKTIAIVNSLKAFKDSLNEGMTFMDSVATSSSTSS
jgi:hypothetical protein